MTPSASPPAPRTPGVGAIAPLVAPVLARHYAARADRLRALATDDHPLAAYLRLAARIADAQQATLDALPLPADDAVPAASPGQPPLAPVPGALPPYWRAALAEIVARIDGELPAAARDTLDTLRRTDDATLDALAAALLDGDYAAVGSARGVFLWAALSLAWAQRAARLAPPAILPGGSRPHCPACGGAPVASVVLGSDAGGLRYLQCGLCDSRWHAVRARCSNCGEGGKLDYWSLDSERAAVKAESCGDCGSYLKALYLEQDPRIEAVADDLASLALDAEVEREGFARSSVNPFMLPGG